MLNKNKNPFLMGFQFDFKKVYKGNDKLHEINNLVLLFNYQLIQYLNNKDSYRIDLFIFTL